MVTRLDAFCSLLGLMHVLVFLRINIREGALCHGSDLQNVHLQATAKKKKDIRFHDHFRGSLLFFFFACVWSTSALKQVYLEGRHIPQSWTSLNFLKIFSLTYSYSIHTYMQAQVIGSEAASHHNQIYIYA